jgi:hypothetical protein
VRSALARCGTTGHVKALCVSHRNDNLASSVAFREVPESRGNLAQGIAPVD